MTVRMRINRGATGRRRSHHAISGVSLGKCSECGAMKVSHVACMNCGKYRGRVVVDVVRKVEKKAAKNKRRESTNAR